MTKQAVLDTKNLYFIQKLKEARIKANYSQAQVAEHMHVRQSTYSYWESGRNKIDYPTLLQLAEFLQVDPSYFELPQEKPTEASAGTLPSAVAEYAAQNLSEKLLLKNFRKFNALGQEKVLELMNYLNECHELTDFEFATGNMETK